MITAFAVEAAVSAAIFPFLRATLTPQQLFLDPWRSARVFRFVMSVTEIQITKVNWKRHRAAQDADGIVAINCKITEQQDRADGTAFPKSERNHAFTGPLRRDPLNHETNSEDDVAGPADDLPKPKTPDSDENCVGRKVKAVHKAET